MSVNTDGLMNWPDPASLQDASLTLVERGASFAEEIDSAHSIWGGLTSCYESPHQHLLYSSLDSAQADGDQVALGCASIALAIDTFAEAVHALKNRRTALIEDAATFNAQHIDPEAEDYLDKVKEGVALQGRIDALVGEYKAAIDDCYGKLSAINNDGSPGDTSAMDEIARDSALTTANTVADSRKVRIHRAVRRVVVRVGGRNFRLPPHQVKWRTGGRFWDRAWGSAPPAAPGDFATKAHTGFFETIFGPRPGQYGRPHVFSPNFKGNYGIGIESTVTTKIGTSGWGRAAGRGLFAAGIVLTFTEEHDKADKRYREQNPELTESERRLKTIETTTVRSTAKITGAALAGVAVGSAIPVGGPLIGLGIGLAVGLGMSIPVGEGKTVGDVVADVGEAGWNFLKRVFK